eukprot:SAG31_NODE_3671_length_4002_cov_3.065334_3_plen_145_part_00
MSELEPDELEPIRTGLVECAGWLDIEDVHVGAAGEAESHWVRHWCTVQGGVLALADSPELAADAVGHFSCTIPLAGVVLTAQPKTLRKEAPFAFRLDVLPASDVRGSRQLTKLIIDPSESDSRIRWLAAIASAVCRSVTTSGCM